MNGYRTLLRVSSYLRPHYRKIVLNWILSLLGVGLQVVSIWITATVLQGVWIL